MIKMKINELVKFPVFSFAKEFPYLSEEEEKELAQDLELNGQQHPIIVWQPSDDSDTVILDGRNRLRALQRTKLTEANVEYFEGTEFEAVEKVRALNILRRHLSVGQRAMAALAYLPYEEGEAKNRQGIRSDLQTENLVTDPSPSQELGLEEPQRGGKARDIVAEKFNLPGPRISEAKKVSLNAPDLAEEVKAGEISLDGAVKQLKARNEARDKKVRELEFEAKDLYSDYCDGKMSLDDAYVALINRQKEESRRARENNNEAINLISAYSRVSEERLKEFNLKIQKLTTLEKIDEALSHIKIIQDSIDTTESALSRLREIIEREDQ